MTVYGSARESKIYILVTTVFLYAGGTLSQKVQVHFHGATVLSWKVAGKDVLFQSREAIYDNQAPIRAGIPIAFPHFGQWEAGPTHGFARTSRWKLEEGPQKDSNGNATVVYSLVDTEETRRLWNHKFKLTYTLVFGDTAFKTTLNGRAADLRTTSAGTAGTVARERLGLAPLTVTANCPYCGYRTEVTDLYKGHVEQICRLQYLSKILSRMALCFIKVKNTGDTTFNFTTLLHNYFRVDDISAVTVSGMQGLEYIDKTRNFERFTESRELLTVGEFVDSIYINTPSSHVITGINGGRTLRMDKENFPDTVVWNPWETMSPNFPDLGNDEYLSFICVEAGHVVNPVTLTPGEEFTAVQLLTL
ncbi:putative glucose-6-phosphate 1-epimerase [Branchiostoma floridae]|uniref:Galactose mutarotase n=1 Tax=Branchiostoma floridae TaxID=7739 RepID=A0A9J7HQF2_BRAFL|nr:putative glucose-6-phosphate 1-epimerase [Branchiostoma floridae]